MYRDPKTIGSREFMIRLLYGASIGNHEPALQLRLAKAVMIIAAGDGELSPPEWAALAGGMRCAQMPEAMLDELSRFDPKSTNLEELLQGDWKHMASPARIILYTAIYISRADGTYAEGERAMAAKAAKIMGVDDDILSALEGHAEIEASAAAARAALLYPDRRPSRT